MSTLTNEPLSSEVTLLPGETERLLDHVFIKAFLDLSSDGVMVVDIESRKVLAVNRRAREILGYGDDAVVGRSCRGVLNSPNCDHHCLVNAALSAPEVERAADILYRGHASERQIHAHTRVLIVRAPDGRPLVGVEVFRDQTDIVQMERALQDRRRLEGVVGSAAVMQPLYELVEQVAPYDLPVLLTGESGVGKERFADALQTLSDRAGAPYVRVNCAAINPSLIESELFGHKRGAFTGATGDRRGRFEEADGGTILLDEVGELPLSLQPKLLRLLQQGEVQRVGDERTRTVDVRVLAATNLDIEAAVADGRFREDLYYRLAGVRLHVPPLRERVEDIPALAEHFMERFAADSARRGRPRAVPALSQEALDELLARSWKGNVRELENVLRLAFIRMADGEALRPEHLFTPGTPVVPVRRIDALDLGELERLAIAEAMRREGGNVGRAAGLLGINRTTLWRKLKRADQPAGR